MRTVVKTYKFKLYNNKKNKHLDDGINIAASVWNHCITMHRRYYKMYGKHLSANKLMKHITKVKKTRHPEWQALGSQAIQDVVQRVDRSYKAFFGHVKNKHSSRKSPPSFKKRSRYLSFTLKQAGYAFHDDNKVTIMGREYKYCKSRPIEGKIKTVAIKRNALGEFYIYVVTKQECVQINPRAGKAVGIDFGLKHFLNFDDGTVINSPQWYKSSLNELRASNRAVSRCQKGSNNRKKAVLHLGRTYQHISNRRRDWFFKLANHLVDEYTVLCIEDLNIDGMKRLWGRKVSDVAFAEFVSILEWVAVNKGSSVVKIDRWAPSSKACHVCGAVNTGLSLKQRSWECDCCHTILNRDTNAAINIKRMGLAKLVVSI